MPDLINAVDLVIRSINSLRKILNKGDSIHVQSLDELTIIHATVMSWFKNYRVVIVAGIDELSLVEIDKKFTLLLSACEKRTLRTKYLELLRRLKIDIINLKTENIVSLSKSVHRSSDSPANFGLLIKDLRMIEILINRWNECVNCVNANLPLSATVMMGGLLEGILLAKFNQFSDKKAIFKTKSVPKDKAGKALQLKEWTLRNYIDVAHELTWITQSAKDVGAVLRDYRNYIHPHKEYSHGIKLIKDDVDMFWEITKRIVKQIIK